MAMDFVFATPRLCGAKIFSFVVERLLLEDSQRQDEVIAYPCGAQDRRSYFLAVKQSTHRE
jgi:hypothetical protein